MTDLESVISVLKAGIVKHGNRPLTTQHLLNILSMAKANKEKSDEESSIKEQKILDEILCDEGRYGSS